MKPIHYKQWSKTSNRTKAWLVVKAFGFWTDVWWHVTKDGTPAGNCSGSMKSRKWALEVLEYNKEKLPPTATIRRDLSFWHCADSLNCAFAVVEAMKNEGWEFSFSLLQGDRVVSFTQNRHKCFTAEEKTIELVICSLAMQSKGLLIL